MDTAENWKLKLKTEKYCSKIIFKCVNSTVGPIFNEKVAEKNRKVKLCGYCLLNSAWTVATVSQTHAKKKKKGKTLSTKRQTPNPNSA